MPKGLTILTLLSAALLVAVTGSLAPAAKPENISKVLKNAVPVTHTQPATGPASEPTTEPTSAPVDQDSSLLLDNPSVPLTAPAFTLEAKAAPSHPVPESMVADATCRVVRQENSRWFLLDFSGGLPAGFPKQMRVLPGKELEMLEELTAADPQASFHVTGQTTSYRNQPYILLLSVSQEGAAPLESHMRQPTPTTRLSVPLPPPAGAAPPADDTDSIRKSLTRAKPTKPLVAAPQPPDAEAPNAAPAFDAPAGDILIDRVVRIVRSADGQWLEARFEADNTLQEQPIPLLPCRLLERAVAVDGKVRITGILRRYKGRNYLLLRKAIAERDMGQL
ncbi:MAG: hypothetical protein ABSH10_04605 [Phycisphaerae bacterium]|jgi:hypothetical protein